MLISLFLHSIPKDTQRGGFYEAISPNKRDHTTPGLERSPDLPPSQRRRKKSSKNSISPHNDHTELPASTTAQAVYYDDTPQQDEIGEILSPLVEATKQNSAKEFPAESTEEQDNELGD